MTSLLWSPGRIWNIVMNPDFLQTGHSDPSLLYLIVVYLWLFIELADYRCDCATEGYNVSIIHSFCNVSFMYTALYGGFPSSLEILLHLLIEIRYCELFLVILYKNLCFFKERFRFNCIRRMSFCTLWISVIPMLLRNLFSCPKIDTACLVVHSVCRM